MERIFAAPQGDFANLTASVLWLNCLQTPVSARHLQAKCFPLYRS